MTNLNQLQSELAALTECVNSAMAVTEDLITLTRDELKQLINKVREQTCEHMNNEYESAIDGLDVDNFVELELNGREIEVQFDERQLKRDIIGNVDDKDDVDDTELDTLLRKIKEA
jgi:copper chaperone CopZ